MCLVTRFLYSNARVTIFHEDQRTKIRSFPTAYSSMPRQTSLHASRKNTRAHALSITARKRAPAGDAFLHPYDDNRHYNDDDERPTDTSDGVDGELIDYLQRGASQGKRKSRPNRANRVTSPTVRFLLIVSMVLHATVKAEAVMTIQPVTTQEVHYQKMIAQGERSCIVSATSTPVRLL